METRKSEKKLITSDLNKVLNMYLSKRVCDTWEEEYYDEDTGEVTKIERNEILFKAGTLIDQDILVQLKFSQETGRLKLPITVSDQCRKGVEINYNGLYPHMVTARVGDKNAKILLYAPSVKGSLDIASDYLELSTTEQFGFTGTKVMDHIIILTDDPELYKNGDPDYISHFKYWQLEVCILWNNDSYNQRYIVHAIDAERSQELILEFLYKKQDEKDNNDEFKIKLESVKPISVTYYVPREFSEAYKECQDDKSDVFIDPEIIYDILSSAAASLVGEDISDMSEDDIKTLIYENGFNNID